MNRFSRAIHPYVEAELQASAREMANEQAEAAFRHLERAHILGQTSTYEHTRVHIHMLRWAVRTRDVKEFFGQVVRIVGAPVYTAFGWVPLGNSGGANISPFKVMPIPPDLAAILRECGKEADV